MKKIISLLVFAALTLNLYAQQNNYPPGTAEYFLKKSKQQKTAGWVLLVGGTTLAVASGSAFDTSWDSSSSDTDAYGFLVIAGVIADLVSIPCFISSARNKQRANQIKLNSSSELNIPLNKFQQDIKPAFALHVYF